MSSGWQPGTDDFPLLHDASAWAAYLPSLTGLCSACALHEPSATQVARRLPNGDGTGPGTEFIRNFLRLNHLGNHTRILVPRGLVRQGKAPHVQGHSEIPHDFLRVWNQRDPLE